MKLKDAAEAVLQYAQPLNYGDVKNYSGRGFLVPDAQIVALRKALELWQEKK
jgi:hypothetical protein